MSDCKPVVDVGQLIQWYKTALATVNYDGQMYFSGCDVYVGNVVKVIGEILAQAGVDVVAIRDNLTREDYKKALVDIGYANDEAEAEVILGDEPGEDDGELPF